MKTWFLGKFQKKTGFFFKNQVFFLDLSFWVYLRAYSRIPVRPMAPKASNQEMDQEHQEICPHGPASWHIHYMNLDRMATIQMFKYRLYVLYKYIYMHIRAWCIFKKCLAHGNLHIQSKTDGLKKCRVFFDCTSMLCLWCPQGLLQGHTSQYNRIIHPCSDECGPAQWRFCPDLPACCWVWAGQVLRSRVWCWHILWITMQWSWRWPKKQI